MADKGVVKEWFCLFLEGIDNTVITLFRSTLKRDNGSIIGLRGVVALDKEKSITEQLL